MQEAAVIAELRCLKQRCGLSEKSNIFLPYFLCLSCCQAVISLLIVHSGIPLTQWAADKVFKAVASVKHCCSSSAPLGILWISTSG